MLSTIADGDLRLGTVPPNPPRSDAATWKLAVWAADCGRVNGVDPEATPAIHPTSARAATNNRSGRSRPRPLAKSIITRSIAWPLDLPETLPTEVEDE
jgi:hypothetical protein